MPGDRIGTATADHALDRPRPVSVGPGARTEVTVNPAGATPDPVTIPPLEPLTTGDSWFDAVDANPFHHGLLSGLRAYA